MKFFNKKKMAPHFSEPTDEEIEKTQRIVMVQYGIELSRKNAVRFANLAKELSWWVSLKDDPSSKAKIIDEITVGCRDIYRKKYQKEITESEAINCAETLLDESLKNEKQRIKEEMTAIISSGDEN